VTTATNMTYRIETDSAGAIAVCPYVLIPQ
jgi:hypothetical protein